MLMYPDADIPVLQISLSSSLDPAEHIALGEVRKAGCIGNLFLDQFSFHNMRAFFADGAEIRTANEQFESWLNDTRSTITRVERR